MVSDLTADKAFRFFKASLSGLPSLSIQYEQHQSMYLNHLIFVLHPTELELYSFDKWFNYLMSDARKTFSFGDLSLQVNLSHIKIISIENNLTLNNINIDVEDSKKTNCSSMKKTAAIWWRIWITFVVAQAL